MLCKLIVTFEETELTKLEKDSEPYVVSTWSEFKFYRTEKEKESILNGWKKNERSKSYEVSAMPYRHGMVEKIDSVKIKSIEDIPLSPVTKYFFMYEYQDEVTCWSKSEYFDDEETAYFESLEYDNTTPIMKGVIYE